MTLSLDGVESRYGDSQVLFGMKLSVAPGEVATLLGRNGSGKTTLMRVAAGRSTGFGSTACRRIASPAPASAWCPKAARSFPT